MSSRKDGDDERYSSDIIKSELDLPQEQQPREQSNLSKLTSNYGTPPERSRVELAGLDAVREDEPRSNTESNIHKLEEYDDKKQKMNPSLSIKQQDDYYTGSQTSLYQDNMASERPKTAPKIQITTHDSNSFDSSGISTKSSPLAPLKKSSSIRVLARPGFQHQSGSLDNLKQASNKDLVRPPTIRTELVDAHSSVESLSNSPKTPTHPVVSSPLFTESRLSAIPKVQSGLSNSASKVKSLDKLLAGEIEISKIKKSPSKASSMSNLSKAVPDKPVLSASQSSLSTSVNNQNTSKDKQKERSKLLGYSMPIITLNRDTNHRKAYRAENQEIYIDIDNADDSASDYDFYSKDGSSDEEDGADYGDYDFYSEHSLSDDDETPIKAKRNRLIFHKSSRIGIRKGLAKSLNFDSVVEPAVQKLHISTTAPLPSAPSVSSPQKRSPNPEQSQLRLAATEPLPPVYQLKKSDSNETLAPSAKDSTMYQYLAEGKPPPKQSQVPSPRVSSNKSQPHLNNYYMQESTKSLKKARKGNEELFSEEDGSGTSDTMKYRTKRRLKQKKTATISVRKGVNVPIGTQSQVPTVADKVALMESQHIFNLPWFHGKRNMAIPKALRDPKVRRQLMQLTVYNPRFTLGMILINIIIFSFQLLHAYLTIGEVFQMDPLNIMIGPRHELLVSLGGRFVPCMKTGYEHRTYDCSVFYPKTTPSRTRFCKLDQFCAVLGSKTETPNQLWRLLTAMFLHAGVLHVLSNVIFLWQVGSRLEKIHGPRRIAVIYLLSGFGGFLFGSNLTTFTVTVGASGAIYGLLGCNLLDLLFNFQIVPNRWSELASLLFSTLIYLGVGLLPSIDNFAHIGGFFIGILCGLYMLKPIKFGKTDRIVKTTLKVFSLPLIGGAFIYLFFQFFSTTDTCTWCKYLDCLPINGWCDDKNYNLNSV